MRAVLLVLLLFWNITSNFCMGGELDSMIDIKEVDVFEVNNVTVLEAVVELATKCRTLNILVTFEEAVSMEKDSPISIKIKNETVRSILEKIVGKDYFWKTDGSIVNIIPLGAKGDHNYILNEKINQLNIQNKTREEIVEILLGMINDKNPDKYRVKNERGNYVSKLITFQFPYEKFGMSRPILKRHKIEVRNKSFREILNVIAIRENISWYTTLLDRDKDEISILLFGDELFSQSSIK